MKVYVINLERAAERRKLIVRQLKKYNLDYELIEAVDGKKLTEEELNQLCDMEEVKARPRKLTIGALGCALSHLKAYRKLLADNVDAALILEDDAILSREIGNVLELIRKNIRDNEAILLHYFTTTPDKVLLSRHEAMPLNERYSLLHPINFPFSGTAYVIKKETARALTEIKLPIRAEADDWGHFFENGAIDSLRCVYPKPINVSHAQTQVQVEYEYNELKTFRQKLVKFIYDNKIPILFQMVIKYAMFREKHTPAIVIVDEPSSLIQSKTAARV